MEFNLRAKEKLPIERFLKAQGRFKHLFKPGNEHLIGRNSRKRLTDVGKICYINVIDKIIK